MFRLRLRPSPGGCHGSKGLGGPLVSPSTPGPVFLCSLQSLQPSKITDWVKENWPRDGRKLLAIPCPQNRAEPDLIPARFGSTSIDKMIPGLHQQCQGL